MPTGTPDTRRIIHRTAAFLRCGLVIACGLAAALAGAEPDDEPLDALADSSGLRATVLGPDPASLAELPRRVPLRELNFTVDGALPVPDLFWFNRRLRVWFSAQPKSAPLVIVIAGAGGDGNSLGIQRLRGALYGAGYHVLTVPSPTFPRFIVAASSTGVAGDLLQDTGDLQRAIRQALDRLPRRIGITAVHVIGYSLGGAHAALLKAHDEGPDALGVERVVMINPPVSLFASMRRLDHLFTASIGEDGEAIDRLYRRLLGDLAELYERSGELVLDQRFLLEAAARLLQTDRDLAAAISLTFRLALLDMVLIGDYYAGTGLVIDPQQPPGVGDPLEDILRELQLRPFRDYFEQVFAPYYLQRRPGWTPEELIAANNLRIVADHLREDTDYLAQHNRDDFIVGAEELAWLREVLGGRLRLYEGGGHLGNLGEQQQVSDMLRMLAGDWPDAGDGR